jgi:superoxide dismutase, Cu-Zn family
VLTRRHLALVGLPGLVLAGCAGADDAGGDTDVAAGSDSAADDPQEPDEDAEAADAAGEGTAASEGVDVVLEDVDGGELGTVRFVETPDGVLVEAQVRDLTPGFHGFHLHEEPVCEPDAEDGPFTTAGGHWDPDDTDHGDHPGDLPPLRATDAGDAYLSVLVDGFTLADLEEGEGRAVIVHDGPDNLGHVPDRYTAEGEDGPGPDQDTRDTGDAGDRVACGTTAASD